MGHSKEAKQPAPAARTRTLPPRITGDFTSLSCLENGGSTGKLDELLLDFQNREIDLRILNLDIDTSTSSGKLMFRIVSALAESERDLIAERTRSALEAKRRRGERVGGRKPSHTPEQVRRAMHMLETTDLTGHEVAQAVGMSRSRMYRSGCTDEGRGARVIAVLRCT